MAKKSSNKVFKVEIPDEFFLQSEDRKKTAKEILSQIKMKETGVSPILLKQGESVSWNKFKKKIERKKY